MVKEESNLPILGFLVMYSIIFGIRAWTDSPVEGTLLFTMNSVGLYKSLKETSLLFGLFTCFLMITSTVYCYKYIHYFTLDLLNIGFLYGLAILQLEAKYPLTSGEIQLKTWGFVFVAHLTQGILLNSWLTTHEQKYYASNQLLNSLGKLKRLM